MKKNVHDNSIECYHELDTRTRNQKILDVFKASNNSLSDREVCQALGYQDMNSVRPRITELIGAGMIMETGYRYEARRKVRVCEMLPMFKCMVTL